MNIKSAYYYLFYKLYRFFEEFETTRWLTKQKAEIVMVILDVWLLFPFYFYYEFFFHQTEELTLFSFKFLAPLGIIILINYMAFIQNENWKNYVQEFDRWPKKKNRIGTWVVAAVIVFIAANLAFSFYLMGQIDWRQYRNK